jgi:hypothetical protein
MKLGIVKCPHCGAEWKGPVSTGADRLVDENGDPYVSLGPQLWGRIATNMHRTDEHGNEQVRNADGTWSTIGRRN